MKLPYCVIRLVNIPTTIVIKQGNVSSFYDNGGGYVHKYNDTSREFNLHLSGSNLQNAAMATAHLYTLLARMFF